MMNDLKTSKSKTKSGEFLFVVLFVLLAVFLLARMPDQVKWFSRTKWSGQPALWPAIGVIGMVVFGGLHLATRFRKDDFGRDFVEVVAWLRSFEYVAWFMAYVLAVPWIGYLPATLIVAPMLTFRVGYRSKRMLLSSVGMGLGVVLVFKTFLEVKIPGGAVYEYLPTTLRSFMILNF
jgi:hypothetical protein